ncbi:MAG: HAMP domain-containing histidine kinase [Gammaproteobacteria bacterium]|nr:HAMP domain-containing histidine kinase [Gammaproteobacteria bacterium]
MRQHSKNNRSEESILLMSRSLIERAMELRSLAYYSHAKHKLLVETILEIDAVKREAITSSKNMEELNRIKNLFIASMTHELSNPLTTIIGYSELIKAGMAGPLTDKQSDYLINVIKSAEHLKSIVADAMDIAKIESNVVDAEIEQFELREVVDFVLNIISSRAEDKGIIVEVYMHEQIKMETDKRRLTQCLLNIIDNAIKYTMQGKVTIQATMANEIVDITVVDTGIGLTEEELRNLFQAFNRGGSAKRSKELGSGIGLFLTNKLVNNILQGAISVQSKLDSGSEFKISIPVSIDH